jgi:DNA polymerase-3 subunit epsilon
VIGVYLFFDTETSGLPVDYQAPPSKGPNWPRIVTIAWVVTDDRGRELRSDHRLIRPDGWAIGAEAERIHGITTEYAVANGEALSPVLTRFAAELDQAGAIIAHNVRFDSGVIGSEYLRLGRPDLVSAKLSACTMLGGVDTCKLPGRGGGYKWPRLVELHDKLFGASFQGAHHALADTRACAKCFFELRRRGLFGDYRPSEREPVAPKSDPTVAAIEELLR